MIPLGEKHLRSIVREWIAHYNHGRPHRSLGPGLSERKTNQTITKQSSPASGGLARHDKIGVERIAP
jgi:transposase InsO family protein